MAQPVPTSSAPQNISNSFGLLAFFLFLPLVVYFVLMYQALGGIEGSADLSYATQAQLLWDRVPMTERTPYTGRVLIEWAIAGMHVLAGPTMYWSGVIATVLSGAGIILLLTIFGGRVYGQTAALIATLTLATCPLYIRYFQTIESDPFMLFFWTVAVLQYRYAMKRKQSYYWFFVGIWIGLSTLGKQLGVILFPGIVIYMFFEEKAWKTVKPFLLHLVLIVGGGGVVLAVYLIYSKFWYGDWLAVFEWLGKVFTVEPDRAEKLIQDTIGRGNNLNYIFVLFSRHFSFFGWIFFCALPLAMIQKRFRFEAMLGLAYFAYLLFGTVSLSHYKRMWYLERYILPLTIPMAICFGGVIQEGFVKLNNHPDFPSTRLHAAVLRIAQGACAGLLCFSLLCGMLTVSKIAPFWGRTRMIYAAIFDKQLYGTPVFATSYFRNRYRSALLPDVWQKLEDLPPEKDLPERCTIFVDNHSWSNERVADLPWKAIRVTAQPIELTRFRKMVDALRKRDANFYEKWYEPHFYRLDLDSANPVHSPVSPSWVQEKKGKSSGSNS